ncbi:MAG: homocysteine S-methyltransferase [Chloroflexota bacterium]
MPGAATVPGAAAIRAATVPGAAAIRAAGAGRPDIVILDGGLATELAARGHDLTHRLWSARLLMDEPQAIEDVHLAYFQAGARVATTASYQATIPGFATAGMDRAAALGAIRRSVELAGRAADRHASLAGLDRTSLVVAGSVGPYGAMLADGSEYRGDYDPGRAVLRDFHAPRMEALLEAGADLLALETIPTVREAEVLAGLVIEFGARAWLSFQCRDGRSTAAGEPIAEAMASATGPAFVAVGVNCTAPRHLVALLEAAASATDRPLIAYPNGGDRWDAQARAWVSDAPHGPPLDDAPDWAAAGAKWIGGCCGTGPADIRSLATLLDDSR